MFCRIFFVCILAAFIWVSVKIKNAWAMVVLTGSFLFQAAFSALVYQLHIWHYISLGFVLIWAVWVLGKQAQEKGFFGKMEKGGLEAIGFLLALLSVMMFMHWNSQEEPSSLDNAINGFYSDGGSAADFIRDHISQEELVVSDNIPMASTILAYLKDHEFYYAGSGEKASYADWSEEQSRLVSYEELLGWVKETFPDKKEFYLIQTTESCIYDGEEMDKWEVLYQSECKTVRDEEYRIRKVRL